MQVDQSLVDSHLVGVPSLGSLSVWCLSGGDLEDLGGKSNRSLDSQLLSFGTLDKLSADLLERLDLSRSKGNSDLVNFL